MEASNIIISNGTQSLSLDTIISSLQLIRNTAMKRNDELTVDIGRKFIRVWHPCGTSRSSYFFLDFQGNIYMCATWRAPAKGIRGSIFDKQYSYGKGLNDYGARALR